jgi:DNA-binding beta-propeller fold protein YncE
MRVPVVVALTSATVAACAMGGHSATRSRTAVAHATSTQTPRQASLGSPGTHPYEYVFPDGGMYVYDIDHGQRLVERVPLPGVVGIRGVAVSPSSHTLFISYGADRGPGSSGSLLAYDLVAGRTLWERHYSTGVDSIAIAPDGAKIYVPDGELSKDGTWNVLDARTGSVIGSIQGGLGPHNTVVGASGSRVYLGGRNYPYLEVASTATDRVIRRIGPLRSGVRPFTINGRETIAYTTATGFLGFEVSSVTTGRVLDTVTFGPRFGWNAASFAPTTPSHGISLSPDERRLWVIDAPNNYVHVFDVSRVPERPPRLVADIKLANPLTGSEAGCAYDCLRDGWLQHSRDGCFVYVGDSGDVYSTTTLRQVAFLPALRNTRKMLEVDWRGGEPVATTSRTGLGYVIGGRRPETPRCP